LNISKEIEVLLIFTQLLNKSSINLIHKMIKTVNFESVLLADFQNHFTCVRSILDLIIIDKIIAEFERRNNMIACNDADELY